MEKLKPKKCKSCGNAFTPQRPLQSVCSSVCAYNHAKALKAKKDSQAWQKEKKALKEKLKTLSEYEAEAKKSFQRYIRLRDRNLPCISCGNKNPKDWAGGHYFKSEIYSGLILDERNCNSQCNSYCNMYRGGAQAEYRIGLVQRYGEDFVKQLEVDANETRQYKWTKEQLIAKKIQYDIKYKELLKTIE